MKYILTLLACCLIGFTSFGQEEKVSEKEHHKKREKMEAKIESKKIGYITSELDLSAEEAEQFWPIYNELSKKRKALREDGLKKDFHKSTDDITEADADAMLKKYFDHKQKDLDLTKTYFQKMETVISKKKLAKLIIVEKRFRSEVLDKVRKRMGRKGKRGKKKEKE